MTPKRDTPVEPVPVKVRRGFQIYLDDAEKAAISEAAYVARQPVSEFIREQAIRAAEAHRPRKRKIA